MIEVWYALLCLTLTLFAVLDGRNLGAGAIHLLVARTDAERRAVFAAIGPLWTWHEVWLIASGGVLFVAFPRVLASAFAGFYLALFLLLWSLVLRGISLEFGPHVADPLWRTFWDHVFALSSALLAVLLGTALGNVVRGVPLDAIGQFTLSFFTDFGVRGRVGILDWYTLSTAAFTLIALMAHGATYLAVRTDGEVAIRSRRLARRLWAVALVLFVVLTAETGFVRPELLAAMARRPAAWIAIALAAGGAAAVASGLRRARASRAFLGGNAVLAGLLGAAAAGLYPVMLHSTLPGGRSITAQDGAAGEHGLFLALLWCPVALLLSLAYAAFASRPSPGRSRGDYGREGPSREGATGSDRGY